MLFPDVSSNQKNFHSTKFANTFLCHFFEIKKKLLFIIDFSCYFTSRPRGWTNVDWVGVYYRQQCPNQMEMGKDVKLIIHFVKIS